MQDIITPERFGDVLYGGFPQDYKQGPPRPFTVAVASGGRHDGEPPYIYVVEASSTQQAWAKALAWHICNEEDLDAYVLASQSHEGEANVPHAVNDMRAEFKRQEDLDDLADEAREMVTEYQQAVAEHENSDGEVLSGHLEDHDEIRDKFEADGWPLVQRLADLDGRD